MAPSQYTEFTDVYFDYNERTIIYYLLDRRAESLRKQIICTHEQLKYKREISGRSNCPDGYYSSPCVQCEKCICYSCWLPMSLCVHPLRFMHEYTQRVLQQEMTRINLEEQPTDSVDTTIRIEQN